MALTSRLALEVDGRGAEQQILAVRRALEGLNEAGLRAGPVLGGAGGSLNAAGQSARSATTQVQGLERQVKSLAASAAGLAGPLVAAFSTKAFYDAAEAYSTLTNRMKLVTSNSTELAESQKAVFRIAQSAYQPLNATAELYQRIAANQKELKLTGEGVAGVVGTISKTLAISGASAASANAALVQLGQAFASGVLRGEELNSVMEQAPALAQAIAAGMGKTVGELRAMGAAGLLTADAVVQALQAQQGAVDALFDKTATTIGNSFTSMSNSFTQLVGRLNEASGASVAISAQFIAVSQAIDALTGDSQSLSTTVNAVGAAMAAAAAGGGVMLINSTGKLVFAWNAGRTAAIAQAQATLNAANADSIKAKTATSAALADMNLYRGTVLQTVAAGRYADARLIQAAADERARAAAAGLAATQRGLIGALGGPAGLALAVGSIAATMFLFRDSANDATKALIDQNLTVDESIVKFMELGEAQKSLQVATWSEKQESAAKDASAAFDAFSIRGREAFAQLGVAGIEGGKAFETMIAGVKDGSKTLPEVTDWVKQNTSVMPFYIKKLQESAAANEISNKQTEKYAQLLGLSSKESVGAAAGARTLTEAQAASGQQTKAQAAEIEKYLAKLREQVTLYGANKQKLAEYEASKLGMNAQQREEARVLGQIQDVQEKYRDSLKKNDAARKESLRIELEALITQRNASEDAATKSVAAISRIHYASDAALGMSVSRRISELSKLASFAASLPGNVNYLTGKGVERPTVEGASMVPIGAPKPQISTPSSPARKTARQETDELLAQINETSEARTKAAKAYTESAGQKMLNQASEQAALLREQNTLYELQKGSVEKIGPEAQKLIKWKQQLADIKGKQTLTADQKDQITAALKANAASERELQIKEKIAEQNQKLLAFQKSITAELALSQQDLSNQLAGVGLGQEGRRRLQEDLKIRQDYQKRMDDLQDQFNKDEITKGVYDKQTSLLESALGQRLSMQEEFYRQLEIQQGDWSRGANAAWQDYVDEASDTAGMTQSAFSDAFTGIEDVFVDFITTGKASFKDFADSVLADLARIVVKQQIMAPLLQSMFGETPSGGSFGQSAGQMFGGGTGSGFTDLLSMGQKAIGLYNSSAGQAFASGFQSGTGIVSGVTNGISAGYASLTGAITGNTAAIGSMQAGYTGSAMANWSAGQAASGAGTAGSAASGFGAIAGGLGGAIQGYQTAGLKGAVAGGAAGWGGATMGTMAGTAAAAALSGTAMGAALGSVLPGIGTVIGAALGAAFGSKIFAGEWETKDQGLSLGITGGGLDANGYEYQKKKGGLFGKNKQRTRLTALDPEMQAGLDASYDAVQDSVFTLFDRLNIDLNEGVLDGMNIAAGQISTKGMSSEQIQEAITKWFGGVADFMTVAVANATGSGTAGYDFTALTEFVNNLYGVNDVIKYLNVGLFDMSVQGGFMAEQLSAMAGGFEALKTSAATYYDGFYSDVEKADNTLAAVTEQFKAMNITLPQTRSAYRDMVEALDLTTESGRQMYTILTGLSGSAAASFDILEQRAEAASKAIEDAMTGRVNSAMSELQKAVSAEQKALTDAYNARASMLNDALSSTAEKISGLKSVSNDLGSAMKALRGDSEEATKMLRAQAQATIASALATARSGGSLAGFSGLDDALSIVGENNTDLYTSMEDFARDQGRTANMVNELNELNGKQLSTEESILKGIQEQIRVNRQQYEEETLRLEEQLALAQRQIDELNGINTSVMSVQAALMNMRDVLLDAMESAAAQKPAGGLGGDGSISSIYNDILGRDPDQAGKEYWEKWVSAGGSLSDLAEALRKDAIANGEIPAFARGGNHSGGIRLVGENGPEIELTGASRIISNKDAARALSGGGGQQGVIDAITALQSYLYMITKNTEQTSAGIRRQNEMQEAA